MSNATATTANPTIVGSIKEWLTTCDNHHIGTCVGPFHHAAADTRHPTRPSWLIDTEKQCVVMGDTQGEYLALSYTWQDDTRSPNDEPQLELLFENIDDLMSTDSLKHRALQLPKIIRDAIELTPAIGKRYLWVDRLCVVQDDPQKGSEIKRMDQIYSGAYMTIAAAADHGMFLTPEETIHSPPVETSTVYGKEKNAEIRVKNYYRTVSRSKWARRAWTYQEYILSKRVVFFLGDRVFWQCECAVWDLNHLQPNQTDEAATIGTSSSALVRRMETPTWPDFSLYVDLICPYNGRELSHQEDGLPAFLGILSFLAPAFQDGLYLACPGST